MRFVVAPSSVLGVGPVSAVGLVVAPDATARPASASLADPSVAGAVVSTMVVGTRSLAFAFATGGVAPWSDPAPAAITSLTVFVLCSAAVAAAASLGALATLAGLAAPVVATSDPPTAAAAIGPAARRSSFGVPDDSAAACGVSDAGLVAWAAEFTATSPVVDVVAFAVASAASSLSSAGRSTAPWLLGFARAGVREG